MNPHLPTCLAALVACCPSLAAERWTPDNNSCNQQPTTYAIATCIDASAKVWDRRLNEAYRVLLLMLKDDRVRTDALKGAQRAWLRYRDANCAFYESEMGTIRLIDVASCNRDMTQARALELQGDGPQ